MTLNTTLARLLCSLACLLPAAAQAQDFPAKPVKLVVPYAPGGATDILGRTIAQKLSEALGQPVQVDNKAGAGGNIGADFVAKSPADGYTLVMGTIGTHAINPSLYATMPFDPSKDFAPVTLALTNQLVLLVNPSVPARTVPELIAHSKKTKLFYGSAGNGSSHHLAGELLKARTGVEMAHVPYKGSGPALVDLVAGNVQVLFVDIAGALPHLKAGKIVPLAVGGAKRSALLPELPTIAEAMRLPDFEVSPWMGVLAPAGTPRAIVAQLNAALVRILAAPDIRERFAGFGAEPLSSSPEEFAAHIRRETAKWSGIVKATGARIE